METKSRKTLFGCLIGCASVGVVGIIAIVTFVIWLNSAGEPLDPEKLIGENTRGYAAWTISLKDPGTAQFFETLMDEIDRAQEQPDLPGPLKAMVQFNQQRNREQMARMFPMTAAWTAVSANADEQEDLHLLTISLSAAANQIRLVDMVMRMTLSEETEGMRQRDYRDEQFFEIDDANSEFVWFIRGGDIYLASGVEPAERVVDLLIDGRKGEDSSEPGPAVAPIVRVDPDAEVRYTGLTNPPIRGAVGNDFGLLARLVESSELGDAWIETSAQVRAIRVYGGFLDDRDFTLAFYIDCGVPGCEETGLDLRAEEFLEDLEELELETSLDFQPYQDGAFVRYDFRRVNEWVTERFKRLERGDDPFDLEEEATPAE